MKKLLLTITILATGFASQAQVVVAGVSPAAVQGNYDFTNQTHEFWPGEAGDGSWDLQFDFNIAGNYIQDTLMFVDDNSQGLNIQGNPISAEGCMPLVNDLTGKIAVIYRNTCEFGTKILNAQNAGAIAVIIINREDALLGMLGATDGILCTIPAVFISNVDGAIITNAMAGGPVVMLIGNKQNAFPNDVGAVKGEYLVSPHAGASNVIYDGLEPGIQVYNFGSVDQTGVMVNASIDGPGGNVYDENIGPLNILSADTVSIFPGNTDFFPAWTLGIGGYLDGDYTLTYTLSMAGLTDDSDFDNIYASDFKIQSDHISLSRLDGANMPLATNYPSNSTTEYQSCMMFQDPNAGQLSVEGMYFIPHTDTSINDLAGAEIFANLYSWDDTWTDLDDPSVDWTTLAGMNTAFSQLNLASFGTHYPASNDDVDDVAYVAFAAPVTLVNNQRYLFCLQTFEPATISFGYDNPINYDANQSIYRQPISPVHIDGQWYTGGWNSSSATSIALKTYETIIGVDELISMDGSAFPNPAIDVVTVNVDGNGAATLKVTDIAGKITINKAVTLVDGSVKVDMSSLESGIYIFNVSLENGQSSQFNVVKK